MASELALDVVLTHKQSLAFESAATEILYGGAAGGGKSHLFRYALIHWCSEIAGLQCYIFRRVFEDLVQNHMDGPNGFRNLLAPWVDAKLVTIIEDQITFWNGSKIRLCHCKDEAHKYKYHGAEIHVLVIDELTTFTESIYRYLRFRVRAVGLDLPDKYQARFPRILAGSNPGNIGHQFVKAAFITGRVRNMPWRASPSEGGMLRQYIPAKLTDNPYLLRDDPHYLDRIRGLGSDQLVKAMEEGNWDVVAGAYFGEFDYDRHVLKPFSPPINATRFRAMDWGSAKPFSVGWYAIAETDWPLVQNMKGERFKLPRGALVRYREYYGCKKDEDGQEIPDTGLKMTVEEVADGIISRSRDERYAYTTADPSMFHEDGGPSHAERARIKGLILRPADNTRVPGWDQVRYRLVGDVDPAEEEGWPMIYFMENQPNIVRTLPALMHDDLKPEDVDSDAEDHPADELRYACMSRPRTYKLPAAKPPASPYQFDRLTAPEPGPRSKYRG